MSAICLIGDNVGMSWIVEEVAGAVCGVAMKPFFPEKKRFLRKSSSRDRGGLAVQTGPG